MAAVPQAWCQERWLELQFTFRGEAQCWSIPQLRIWLLPVGVCTVGFLPIWIHQVRGCISTQQLWNWHALDCLLTVIFLLDFIKTPSVVSADKESNQKYPWREGENVCMFSCVAGSGHISYSLSFFSFPLQVAFHSAPKFVIGIAPLLIPPRKLNYNRNEAVSHAGMETNASLHAGGTQQH